jgi:hypothetical protein
MIDMNEINQKTADVLRNAWVILEMARDQFAEEPPQGMVPANGHISTLSAPNQSVMPETSD